MQYYRKKYYGGLNMWWNTGLGLGVLGGWVGWKDIINVESMSLRELV